MELLKHQPRFSADIACTQAIHGQWKGLRGKGGALCSGAFRYPLFGDAVYEGSLVSGQRHGAGRQVCHSGVYTGEFRGGEMSGSGRRDYCDGTSYEGAWQAGLKHGYGRLHLPCGDKYEGEFRNGEMDGHGVYRLANGDVYTGGMLRGCMHGEGEYVYAAPYTGRYRGHFAHNNRHGKGSYQFEEGGLTYSYAGDFFEGAQTGRGVLHISNGDKYAGGFLDGQYHGQGEYVFGNGSTYKGEFCLGLIDGKGSLVASERDLAGSGERYEGAWSGNLRHGKGVVMLTNGNCTLSSLLCGESHQLCWHPHTPLVPGCLERRRLPAG